MEEIKPNRVLGILLLGTFLAYLNQTLMNVALPSVMLDFNILADKGQWLSNGYLLVNGIMVPATAFLIDRFKTRSLYLSIMVIFTVGTIVCALAPNFITLVVGRMIQAVGAGVAGPLLTVTVIRLFDIELRGRTMGYIGLAMNFAPAVGPTLSGWIVQTYNWRYLFYLILPLLLLTLILAYRNLPDIGEIEDKQIHIPSIVLSTLGLGALLLGFSNAAVHEWLSFEVIGYIGIGLIIITIFVFEQFRIKEPVLNMSVFKSRKFTFATIANFFMIMGLYGGMLLLPLYLQSIRKISPLTSGIILFPGAIVMAVLSPVVGRLYDKYGYKLLCTIGISLLTMGTVPFAFVSLSTPIIAIISFQAIRGVGLTMVLMPIQTEAMNALPTDLVSHGNAMYNTFRQIAGSIGTALLITIMTKSSMDFLEKNSGQATVIADIHGTKTAYIIITILTFMTLVLILNMEAKKTTSRN